MIDRVYHHYEKWEDVKFGFYDIKIDFDLHKIISMFNCPVITEEYMNRVIDEWKYSCEQNLTNQSMNQIAYLGQAASCLYCGAPSILTMKAWNLLTIETRERADKQAIKCILKWKKKYVNTLVHGNKRVITNQYLMKFQLD
jgi:hypothetical protein